MCATEISAWVRRIAVLGALFVSAGSDVLAQQSLLGPASALTAGRTVWITDSSGREQRMRIIGVSGNVVTAMVGEDTRQLSTTDIVRVRVRHSDSVLNGALIGAGAAVGGGSLSMQCDGTVAKLPRRFRSDVQDRCARRRHRDRSRRADPRTNDYQRA